MTISTMRVTCADCKHVFDAEVVTNAPIAVAVASMQAVHCPKCHGGNVGLGGNYDDAPPLTAPLTDRVQWWQSRGEHGTSSNTIYSAFMGTGAARDKHWPLDPDDFRRCKQLLDLIPEWRSNLGKVSEVYPWFAPMIDQWDEIERLYLLEEKTGKCRKTYDFMKPLCDECHALRYGK